MTINLMILAQDRAFARAVLEMYTAYIADSSITVRAIVSERSFYDFALTKISEQERPYWFNTLEYDENKVYEFLRESSIDAAISLQHRWILPNSIIDVIGGRAFNTHFGKLPTYRGHHTHIHALLNDEPNVITTLHFISPIVDMGDVIHEVITEVLPEDTSLSIWRKTVDAGVMANRLLLDFLTHDKPIPRKSVRSGGEFFRKDSIEGRKQIQDPSDLKELDLKSRAFFMPPHEPAFILLENGGKVYLIPETAYPSGENPA